MSLDNIQLPPVVLQALYKHSLVDLGEREGEKEVAKEFKILGNNRSYTLIIVASDETLYLPDEQLNFLLGILGACSLTMDDVGILNINKNKSATYKAITEDLKPEKIFLFGVNPGKIGLPIDFPQYQVQRYNNQTYLTAPPLSDIRDNKEEKTRLWNCLKQIFNL